MITVQTPRWQESVANMALACKSWRYLLQGGVRITAVLAEQIFLAWAWGIWLHESVTKLPCEVLEKR